MKNTIYKLQLLLILGVGLSDAFGQSTHFSDTSFYDSDRAVRHIRYFTNSKPDSIVYYARNGNRTETYIYGEYDDDGCKIIYSETGYKRQQYCLKDNETNGSSLFFYENGQVESKTFYKNNLKQGEAIYYYTNGEMKWQSEYKNDLLYGWATGYYENGNISEKEFYKYGLREGEAVSYYDNGNVKRKSSYHKNKFNGVVKVFYPNGKLQWEGKYEKGRMTGVRLYYDENGNLFDGNFVVKNDSGIVLRETKCINGKPEGELKVYGEDGKLYIKANFKDGLPDGLTYNYDAKGVVTLTELYESGKFVKEIKEKDKSKK